MLWFHEYDDLDVEVGELSDVKWAVVVNKEDQVKEEEEDVKDVNVKKDVHVKKEVNVKMEDVEMDC